MRKEFDRQGVDEITLGIMYVDKNMRMKDIAYMTGKSRQRIYQLVEKYKLKRANARQKIKKICLYCHEEFEVTAGRDRNCEARYCNFEHYRSHVKEVNGNMKPWRDSSRIAHGVVEDWLGFPIPKFMIVHHEDNDGSNNSLSNLWVFRSNSLHLQYHHAKRHGTAELPYSDISELPDLILEWVAMYDPNELTQYEIKECGKGMSNKS